MANVNDLENLNDEEFLLLYDVRGPRNKHLCLPHWKYDRFQLEEMTDEECLVEFRFSKTEIYDLVGTFHLPEVLNCYNGWVVDAVDALCIVLKRYAYPSRYADLVPRFGRSVPLLCTVANQMTDLIFNQFNHLLRDLDQP